MPHDAYTHHDITIFLQEVDVVGAKILKSHAHVHFEVITPSMFMLAVHEREAYLALVTVIVAPLPLVHDKVGV